MTNLHRPCNRHSDRRLQELVASHAYAIATGRSVLAADAVWQIARHFEIPEPGQQVLTAANLDDLKQQLSDRGYELVEARRSA